jgi:hypothetical protein
MDSSDFDAFLSHCRERWPGGTTRALKQADLLSSILAPLVARIKELEKKVATLEQKSRAAQHFIARSR